MKLCRNCWSIPGETIGVLWFVASMLVRSPGSRIDTEVSSLNGVPDGVANGYVTTIM